MLSSVLRYSAFTALICLFSSVCLAQNQYPLGEPAEFGTATVCAGPAYTYQYYLEGGQNYSWSVLGGTIQSGQGTSQITVVWTAAADTKNIDLTFTTGSGALQHVDNQPVGVTTYHYFQDITLQQAGTLSGSVSSCPGASGIITLSGNNTAVSRWEYSINSGATWTPIASTANTYSYSNVTQTTLYRAVIGAVCGSLYSTQAQVTINAFPSAPAASPVSRCGAGSVTLTASGAPAGGSYRWYAAASGGTSLGTAQSYGTPSLSASTTYYVSAVSTAGCESTTRTAVTATINAVPAAPTTTNASRCGTGTLTLTASGAPAGGSYRWYTTLTGGTSNGITTATYSPSLSVTTTYYVSAVSAQGCESTNRTAVTGTVNAMPGLPTAIPGSRCGAGTVVISASGAPATESYIWYAAASGGTALYEASNPSFTTPSLSATTTYYVSRVNIARCESARVPVTATIIPVPTTQPTVSNASRCGEGTLTLNASGAATGQVYRWYSAAAGGTLLQESTSGAFTTPSLTASQTYYVVLSNGGCEYSVRTAVTANVSSTPSAPLAVNASRCGAGTVTLSATGAPADGGYRWYSAISGGTLLASTQNYTTPSISVNTAYYVSAITAQGCESSRTMAVASLDTDCIPAGGNYITINTLQKAGITSTAQIPALAAQDVKREITYVDGFGRTIQSIDVQASPTQKDIVTITEYDAMGRQTKTYLPYTGGTTGAYRPNAKTELSAFYGVNATANKVATTAYPYGETVYEASGLNKVLEQGAAGEDWQLSTGHTKKALTRPCAANEVRMWDYNFTDGSITSPGFYVAGDALAKESTDEHGITTISYTDKSGHEIAVRSQVAAGQFLWTCNVYDAFGNLRAAIQPEGYKELLSTGAWTLTQTFLDKWCFVYKYDEWQRLSEKKVPGASAVYIVYNKKNQPVLEQNGELRKTNRWMFTKYDGLGRKVLSGTYTHNTAATQAQMQALAGNNAGYEFRTSENYNAQQGYTVTESFPMLINANSEVLSVKYYDDYDFDRNLVTPGPSFVPLGRATEPVPSYSTTGLVTGGKEKILGDTRFLSSAIIYDDQGRPIQTQNTSIRNGNNITTSRLSFTGQLLESVTYYAGSDETYVKQQYTYDHAGRLKKLAHQAERDETVFPMTTVAAYNYNELGQQVEKKLHSTDDINFLQTVDYRYNIRGWLASINDANLSDPNDLFGIEFKYSQGLQSPFSVSPLYNGNIAEALWKDAYSNKQQVYAFSYDQHGWLLSAKYASKSGTAWIEQNGFNETMRYDLNGNILGLTRNLWPSGATAAQLGDDLTYTYSGNQLKKVEDAAGALAATGFVNGANDTDEYIYNANGSVIQDKNKGITSVTYNVFELPVEVVIAGKGKIVYKYDASGKKLSKQVIPTTGAVVTTEYSGGAEFIDNVLKWIPTEEGRLVWQSTASINYEYALKDHLGNVRVNFDRNPATGKARVIQKSDYYAFGMMMPGNYISGQRNKYQFNGKELQDELGLDWYDFEARFYEPQLGRWHVQDPLAQKLHHQSPYISFDNNPVKKIDPDGKFAEPYDEFDQFGKKISDLGGDKIDFYHQNNGDTKIVDRKTGASNTITGGEKLIRGFTHRNKDVSWGTITSEFLLGRGPVNSLISDFDDTRTGAFGSLDNATNIFSGKARQDLLNNPGKQKNGVSFNYLEFNPLTAGGDMWQQMWGRTNVSWYKLGDQVLFLMADSKSNTSLTLRAGVSWERSETHKERGNTYQTYIWTESMSEVRARAQEYQQVRAREQQRRIENMGSRVY